MSATFLNMSPVAWSALAEWCVVVLAVLAGVVAYQQLREARQLREGQAQPYVMLFAEATHNQLIRSQQGEPIGFSTFVDLVVKNFGRTVAREVRIEFNPELRGTLFPGQSDVVQVPILDLAPGQDWHTMWDNTQQRSHRELPSVYTVRITFYDSRGKSYVEESRLDWNATTNRTRVIDG